ncbi:AAA family ATPase [Undibacterium parvum]|uniref:ATP-dependent Clp protease ATP-binding subunit n=1 Tax=Undibacterium parvum TaxID=401471 RepID=A0A3S9HG31_9BURK|nr:AAA family ATPase [Undibacterium parvum]AZP11062.1 ATP-dependent Clp protease ATP-binding subunit [Undibacterium parvum]
MNAPTPRWLQDLHRLLPIRSHYVISGSIRDSFLMPLNQGMALVPLARALWESLKARDYRFLLIYDPSDGLRVYPDEPVQRELASRLFDLKLADGCQIISLESLSKLMKKLSGEREARCALVLDFASRISRQAEQLGEAEHRFFVAAEKNSLSAAPLVPKDGGVPLFNPVLWLLNRAQDLPSWFTLDSERVASLLIAKPDFETRQAAAQQLAPLFAGYAEAGNDARAQFIKSFTEGSEGMSLTALSDITELADRQQLGISMIDDAVRCYKVGALDNPWRKDYLREKIRDAHHFIEDRVKGQHPAVVKTLDILKRSVMGLTGAQARSGGSRPRGVLFFAGPTGVGKTELAKTLTQLIFGDERAYLRFDMSEFAEEHSGARLLGAPPGYVGFDAGGELTNAVREKPFSVVLFDEIEKAHPRILDKFLQILEDGRLTDGRGDTAYFSETILVFTSNLGIYVEDQHGQRIQNVQPGDSYDTVELKVREAIGNYFKFKLSRPELLNRIGDNIVVFNFISLEVAAKIFDSMLRNVARRVQEELQVSLSMPASVRDDLFARCTKDLSNGGRGIGNQLESCFINPLSRALFEHDLEGKQRVIISAVSESDKVISLSLQTA